MSFFLVYLVVINIVALLLFTLDFVHWWKTDRDLIDHRLLSIFSIVGGGVGMLTAFLIWDRRANKDNVAWRMIAIVGIIIWAFITAFHFGLISFDIKLMLAPFQPERLAILLAYLSLINLVTFFAFINDKIQARRGFAHKRLPEFTLLVLSLVGGAVGGLVAMHLARHKTSKWYFTSGLPFFILLQLILFLVLKTQALI